MSLRVRPFNTCILDSNVRYEKKANPRCLTTSYIIKEAPSPIRRCKPKSKCPCMDLIKDFDPCLCEEEVVRPTETIINNTKIINCGCKNCNDCDNCNNCNDSDPCDPCDPCPEPCPEPVPCEKCDTCDDPSYEPWNPCPELCPGSCPELCPPVCS